MTSIRLHHILHRSLEEMKATRDVAKAISWRAALITFRAKIDIQIMNRNGYQESEARKNRLLKKHKIMLDFLDKMFKPFWDKYNFTKSMPETNPNLRNKIWICWWQGLENAPEIVKACVESIKRNAGNCEIIIITDKNYKDFVEFPDWLEEKRRTGIINRTIYSDLLRMNILSTYGGLWIDSTFFCKEKCFDQYMNLPLWSIKRPDYFHASVACGYFANYSLGCTYENRWVYKVMKDCLFYYWQHNDILFDYLLTDYVIVLAQKHIKDIDQMFKGIAPNNKNCDELFKVLGQPYDENTWKRISADTALYKLTWKQSFPKEVNGKETFYGKIIDGTLK